MHIDIGQTAQIITIIAFLAGVIKYLIVTPLQNALATLEKAVCELKLMLVNVDREQKIIIERLVVAEQVAKSAHKRIDTLES